MSTYMTPDIEFFETNDGNLIINCYITTAGETYRGTNYSGELKINNDIYTFKSGVKAGKKNLIFAKCIPCPKEKIFAELTYYAGGWSGTPTIKKCFNPNKITDEDIDRLASCIIELDNDIERLNHRLYDLNSCIVLVRR